MRPARSCCCCGSCKERRYNSGAFLKQLVLVGPSFPMKSRNSGHCWYLDCGCRSTSRHRTRPILVALLGMSCNVWSLSTLPVHRKISCQFPTAGDDYQDKQNTKYRNNHKCVGSIRFECDFIFWNGDLATESRTLVVSFWSQRLEKPYLCPNVQRGWAPILMFCSCTHQEEPLICVPSQSAVALQLRAPAKVPGPQGQWQPVCWRQQDCYQQLTRQLEVGLQLIFVLV